ncbi:hypothetical protein FNU79_13230 [Deinococcus detaillensis]|uniref:Uncharacterized protein n=1 Tax=Deinococcus detaillensis TaxID=2592048 RepID=A0A553UQN4_9DEIO|nr:hypothetical protein [Deinococcus detaillensis]TSA82530.1 hypothetical protein FNU79_13230 [Deinococcus detaillensis]
MTERVRTIKKFRLGEEPKESIYWLTRPTHERIAEVFRLRAMWPGTDQPMRRDVVRIIKLGEK